MIAFPTKCAQSYEKKLTYANFSAFFASIAFEMAFWYLKISKNLRMSKKITIFAPKYQILYIV